MKNVRNYPKKTHNNGEHFLQETLRLALRSCISFLQIQSLSFVRSYSICLVTFPHFHSGKRSKQRANVGPQHSGDIVDLTIFSLSFH